MLVWYRTMLIGRLSESWDAYLLEPKQHRDSGTERISVCAGCAQGEIPGAASRGPHDLGHADVVGSFLKKDECLLEELASLLAAAKLAHSMSKL